MGWGVICVYNFTVGFPPKRVMGSSDLSVVVLAVAFAVDSEKSFADGEKRDDFGKLSRTEGRGKERQSRKRESDGMKMEREGKRIGFQFPARIGRFHRCSAHKSLSLSTINGLANVRNKIRQRQKSCRLASW